MHWVTIKEQYRITTKLIELDPNYDTGYLGRGLARIAIGQKNPVV